MPAAATTPDPAAGRFPAEPQVVDDFEDPGSGWPRTGYREGVYVVSDGGTGAVLAPQRVTPATRGTLAEVALEPSRGGAGLLCRAASDGSAATRCCSAPTAASSSPGSTTARRRCSRTSG